VYLSDVDVNVDSCLAALLVPVLLPVPVPVTAEEFDLAMKPSPIRDKKDGVVGDVAEDVPT